MARKSPVKYSRELAAEICSRVAAGEALTKVCASEDMPTMDAVVRWANDPDTTGGRDGFAERWYRAICTRAYLLIEEALEIVDDDSGDFKTITTKGGGEKVVIDHDNIQRAKLKYEARKWIATRFAPRVFGDHKIVQHNHSGAVGLQRLPDTELDQRLESLTQQLHQKQPIEHQE